MANQINDDLALELKDLRSAAHELKEGIDRHNFLPLDFPKSQVELHLLALGGLIDGSLEGAKLPLEHASVRLSEIRRKHFVHHQEFGEEEQALPPVLQRGDSLDARFTRLLSAISTALDAYREQSRTEYDSVNFGEYLELMPGLGASDHSTRSVHKHLGQLDQLASAARGSPWSNASQVQKVAVSAVDAMNVLAATEAEAMSTFVIRGWAKRLARGSADALSVLSKSIKAVEVAGGVAHEFYLRYKSSVSKVRDVVIVETRDWLKFLSSKLADGEKALRTYADGHRHENFGLVTSSGGHHSVITSEFIAFPVNQSELKLATKGSMVEFDLDTTVFPPVAKNLRLTSQYLLVEGKLLTPEDAREPILRQIENYLGRRPKKMAPLKYLERRLVRDKSSHLPAKYWKLLGYDTLTDFIRSSETLHGFPSSERMTHVGLEPLDLEMVSAEIVRDWAYRAVGEIGGRISIGELARLASLHFSDGVLPVRLQVGIDQFSSIFDGDRRFWIENGSIETDESMSQRLNIEVH